MKTKEELEQAILMHEEALESSRHSVIVDTQDLEQAKKDLASFNKPELTGSQLDDINEAVEKAVGNFDFDDADNYNTDCKPHYPTSHRLIITSLQDITHYRDLTIEQVNNLITFLPSEFKPKGNLDMFYGDNILLNKYIIK